ncbi:MAG: TlpA family protein disulfide reductase [Deltaproteobacteria bacterium]|nr:TlpA family protein disulfide reductase [Deltaproteobacteria bacterium]
MSIATRQILSAFVLASASLLPRAASAAPEVGKPLPDFALRDREGALVSVSHLAYPGPADPRRPKHVVLLDFFRTDCKPCVASLPKLVELHKKYGQRGLKVIMVALHEDDDGAEKLAEFLQRNPVPFTVLEDPYGVAAGKYVKGPKGVTLPALFLGDREGVLRGRWGFVDGTEQRKLGGAIEGYLKSK